MAKRKSFTKAKKKAMKTAPVNLLCILASVPKVQLCAASSPWSTNQALSQQSRKSKVELNFKSDSTIPVCHERTAKSNKACRELKSSQTPGAMGIICTRVLGKPAELEVTFDTLGNWTLLQADFWFGDDIVNMPVKNSGYPSLEMFPIFFSNSSGVASFRTKSPIDAAQHCPGYDIYELTAVAHARLQQHFGNGTLKDSKQHAFAVGETGKESSKWFSWFNIAIDCGCEKYGESGSIAPEIEEEPQKQEASVGCIGQTMEAQHVCHESLTRDQKIAGYVCIGVSGSPPVLDVMYTAFSGFTLLRTAFWFGPEVSAIPDIGDFDFFWRNSSGENTWSTKVPIASYYSCSHTQHMHIHMVAHSVVASVFNNGTLDMGSEEPAYVHGLHGSSTVFPNVSFSFPMQCQCNVEKSAEELPTSSLSSSVAADELLDSCPQRVAESEQVCYDVIASDGTSAGSTCVSTSAGSMKVTREVAGDWTLLKTKFWYGDVSSGLPRKRNGVPNAEKFPYFWGNSSGETAWSGSALLNSSSCLGVNDYELGLVVHSTVIKRAENGTFVSGTKESMFSYQSFNGSEPESKFGWTTLKILCRCTKTKVKNFTVQPSLSAFPSTNLKPILPPVKSQSYCIDGAEESGQECHRMMVGRSVIAGVFCVEGVDDSEYFQFTFKSTDGWTLLAAEFWLGNSIEEVPMLETGDVNTKNLPYYWRNSTGEQIWQTNVALNTSFDCKLVEGFKLAVVASSTFGKISGDGILIEDTEVVAFVEDNPDSRSFGWFALGFKCDCGGPINSFLKTAKSLVLGGDTEKTGACEPSAIVYDEDFEEEGSAKDWNNGNISSGDKLSYFLGPLGGGRYTPQEVSREFLIPASPDGVKADRASVEFVLYTIDTWGEGDNVQVLIGEELLDLGPLISNTSSHNDVVKTEGGMSWSSHVISQGQNLGFGKAEDKKHLVELTIPSSYFAANNTLLFGVRVISVGNAENCAGIDDVVIEAKYNCSQQDTPLQGTTNSHNTSSSTFPTETQHEMHTNTFNQANATGKYKSSSKKPHGKRYVTADVEGSRIDKHDEGPYCVKESFPCGMDNFVYVCHYSRLHGHQTLCISEEESHILQYYPHDYCGPCIGIFRLIALFWQWI